MGRALVASPLLCAPGNGLQSVPAVLHPYAHQRWTMMMSWLQLWHRAAEAGSVLQIGHGPRPAAAVQQITMPGALQELGTTTWSATSRV